jgi:hypothetical protein
MAGKHREKIRESEITGLKYFKKLLPLLERLYGDGSCPRQGRQSQAAFRSVLHADPLVSLQPGRHVAAWLAAGERTEEDRHGGLSYFCRRPMLRIRSRACVRDGERYMPPGRAVIHEHAAFGNLCGLSPDAFKRRSRTGRSACGASGLLWSKRSTWSKRSPFARLEAYAT